MDTAVAIRVEGAVKTFGGRPATPQTRIAAQAQGAPLAAATRVAVNDVSFDVLRGEIFGLVGPNGSGKSTLIRLLATLLRPEGGRIRLFGRDPAQDPPAALGVVDRAAVEASFFKKLSPVENLLYGARLYGVRPGETRRRVLDILRRLGLAERDLYRPVETLSRGTQQKVAIARAFLGEPRVLLLDEPTTGLDPRARREVQAFVRELRDHNGATVVLSTHDLAEAEALCDRVAVVVDGRLRALDTPARLKALAAQTAAEGSLEDAFLALTGQTLAAED